MTIAVVIALLALVFLGGGASGLLIALAELALLGVVPVGSSVGP